jgi:tyrosinase
MLNRRAFVTGASALAMLGGIRASVGQGATGTRRSVRGMTANDPDLAAYRRGVAAMKALPASDPRNWTRFAAIHASFCPHGNWYFLPWHRAYLVALENIIRDLADKPDFALPYWDWSAERQLPPAFGTGTPRNNPLNHPRPEFSPREALPEDMVGPQVLSRILASPDFEAFGSVRPRGQNSAGAQWQRRIGAKTELEFNPHDGVHGALGGDMAQVGPASRDPIFYLHHANVDRLWAMWNARGNANSSEAMWRNFAFNRNFINADGQPWNVAVVDLQSPAALRYRYDDEEGPFAADVDFSGAAAAADDPLGTSLRAYRQLGDNAVPRPTGALHRVGLPAGGAFYVASAENEHAAAHARSISIPVSLGRPLSEVIKGGPMAAASPMERRRDRQYVMAVLRDVEAPTEPTTRVRIFVNREGVDMNARAADPHYVTTLSFFGAGHGDHRAQHGGQHGQHSQHTAQPSNGGTSLAIDLSPALSRLRGTKHFRTDKITVQIMPVCRYANSATSVVRPRRVEIAIL